MFERILQKSFIRRVAQEALGYGVYGAGVAGEVVAIVSFGEMAAARTNGHMYEQQYQTPPAIVGPVELTPQQEHVLEGLQKAEDDMDNGQEHLLWGVGLASAALATEGIKLLAKIDRKITLR